MALQASTARRNSCASALIAGIAGGTLRIRSGSVPANCAATRTGTTLSTITLPSPAFGSPSGGTVALTGTWEDLSADATGTPGYFDIEVSGAIELQGTVTITGGGGDLTVNSATFTALQPFTITSASFAVGGA